MYLSIFFNIFLAQAVVGFIVLVCLKNILDNQLLDLAYRQIDYWKAEPGTTVNQVVLITHRRLKNKNQQRFQRIVSKRLGSEMKLVFQVDRGLWGGAVLRIDSKIFDHSLKDRLRQAVAHR